MTKSIQWFVAMTFGEPVSWGILRTWSSPGSPLDYKQRLTRGINPRTR